MLDSFDMVTLVATLDKTYGISIEGTDIVPENFKNLQTIEALLRQYGVRAMNFTFRRKRISGLLAVVPAHERSFVEEMKNFNFPEARSPKLKEVMGYDKHRLVEPGVCVSDLAVFGLQHLFERELLKREEIRRAAAGDAVAGPFHAAHQQHHPGSARAEARHVLPGHQPGLRRLRHRADPGVPAAGTGEHPQGGADQRRRAEPQDVAQGPQHLPADGRRRVHHGGRARPGGLGDPRQPARWTARAARR